MLKRLAAMTLVAACASLMSGCAEAYFTLAPESRLPRWFHVLENTPRSSLTLTLSTYEAPWPRDVFRLTDADGVKIADVTSRESRQHPATIRRDSERAAYTDNLVKPDAVTTAMTNRYPRYSVVTIGGVTEVLEFRRAEPLFYVSDDAALRAEAGITR